MLYMQIRPPRLNVRLLELFTNSSHGVLLQTLNLEGLPSDRRYRQGESHGAAAKVRSCALTRSHHGWSLVESGQHGQRPSCK